VRLEVPGGEYEDYRKVLIFWKNLVPVLSIFYPEDGGLLVQAFKS
jgi:hypothetical protein